MQPTVLRIALPAARATALRWVSGIVFEEMLGLSIEVSETPASDVVLSAFGRRLVMRSVFPGLDKPISPLRAQIPLLPLTLLDAERVPEVEADEPLPILFGSPSLSRVGHDLDCGFDVLGSVFFMLSRFEEVALSERDTHDRFSATASLAWRGGFLYRPIVDEYVEVLWALMKRLWPGLPRKRRQGQVNVSCDVDQPFDNVGKDPIMLARVVRYELIKKRRPNMAARRMMNYVAHQFGSHRFDPFHTFGWYMDVCERHNRRAAFYFIADHSHETMDGTYEIDDPRILSLMHDIARRGHEIGMHGSYNTYRDGPQLMRERQRLERACEMASVRRVPSGNRQHYLRWDTAKTPDLLDAAGFEYDTTGSFADRPGFRYGTSHSFPMWSWQTQAPLRILQKPLVVMEGSIISQQYLGLGHSREARNLMQTLKDRSLRYGGDFNILWHNSEFFDPEDRELFEQMLK